jgi:hypothetical protein
MTTEVITNEMVNPSVEVNASGWGVQWFGGAPGAGTYGRDAAGARVGGWGYRKIWTVASSHDNDSGFNFFVVGSLVGGRCYGFRVTCRASKASGMIARIQWRDPANVAIGPEVYLPGWGVGESQAFPANTWVEMTGVLQAPPGTTGCRFVFGVHSNNGATPGSVKTWAVGDTHDADRVMVAQVPSLISPVPLWFDGDSPDDPANVYAWTGGAHGSKSTWTRDLSVAALNRVPDPRFASVASTWTAQGVTVARVADPAVATGQAAEITVTTGNNSNAFFPAGTGLTGMPVVGGATYRYRYLSMALAAATARTTETRVYWYTATGAACVPAYTLLPTGADTVGAYAERSGTAVAPLDAKFSTVWVRWIGALAGEKHRMAEPILSLAAEPLAYFDGDTPDVFPDFYAWSGTPNASASVHTVGALLERSVVTIGGVDFTCWADDLTIRHGREDFTDQPEADAVTLNMSPDHNGAQVPAIEVGTDVVVTYQVWDLGPVHTRFRGRVTDVQRSWDDAGAATPEQGTCQVVAVSTLADLGRRVVGDEPWPQELDGARALRILRLAWPTLPADHVDPGIYQVVPRDVDRQPALGLVHEAAEAGGGLLWNRADDTLPRYADFEHRRGTVAVLELDACDVLASPTWDRDLSGLVNYVSLTYGVAPEDPPEGSPTEQPSLTARNVDSVTRFGEYGYSATLALALQADAEARANLLVTRNGYPAWLLSDLPVAVDDLSVADLETLLTLDMHSLVLLTGLPAAGSAPTSTYVWVEGWTEYLAPGQHGLTLSVSTYCATAPPARWDDVPPETTWDQADSTWTWDNVVCIGPPANRGRWNDVPATTHWNDLPASLTWDTWPSTLKGA